MKIKFKLIFILIELPERHYAVRVNSFSALNNGRSTVIDRRNSVCDRRKASLNGHHDRQYLDVTAT